MERQDSLILLISRYLGYKIFRMEEKSHILIIDGNNLMFQMFYGMPERIYNKSGRTIHTTIGFISYLLKQIELTKATHVAVVFDEDGSDERKELYSDYKANRIDDWASLPEEEIPFSEEDQIFKCLEYLEIKTIRSKGMEADDAIASIAMLFEKNAKVTISSFDSDFFQLISENVSVLRYRGKASVLWDRTYFENKMGFSPNRYVLFKAMTGDTADNIQGAKGIGAKRGAEIVNSIASIEDAESSALKPQYKKSLAESKEIIERNIQLIKLKYRPEISMNLDELCFSKEKAKLRNSEILSACNIFD